MKADFQDLTNQSFNDLTAVRFSRHVPLKGFLWMWKCFCDKEIEVRACDVLSGHVKSCGCRRKRGPSGPPNCRHCGKTSYRLLPSGNYGRVCHQCANRQGNLSSDPIKVMLGAAKVRAKKSGISFSLTREDISIPEICPVLGIKLQRGSIQQRDASPSIDRIIPELGYVPGNIAIVSYRANRIKNNGTVEEHRRIATWMEEQLTAGVVA